MPRHKKKKSRVPSQFQSRKWNGFAEFAIKKTGATKTPEFKGKPVPRIYRFPPFEKMTELVAKEVGISKRKMSKWSDEKKKNWGKKIRKVKEILSKTHRRKTQIRDNLLSVKQLKKKGLTEKEIEKKQEKMEEFINAVDNVFNLRTQGRRESRIPLREVKLLRKAKKLAPFTTYVKIARRLGLHRAELFRINWAYNKFFGSPYRGLPNFYEGTSVHRLNRAVFRINELKEKPTPALIKEGFDRNYLKMKKKQLGSRYEEFIEAIEKSPQYNNFTKRVNKKKEKGLSWSDAMYEVEKEIFKKRKRINKKNLEKIRSGKLNKKLDPIEYKKTIRLVYHVMEFYWDFQQKMPKDIRKKIKEFMEENEDKLSGSKLKEEKGGLKFVSKK